MTQDVESAHNSGLLNAHCLTFIPYSITINVFLAHGQGGGDLGLVLTAAYDPLFWGAWLSKLYFSLVRICHKWDIDHL